MPGESSVFCFRTETEIPVYLMVKSTDHVSHNTSLNFCHKHFKNPSRLISPVNDLQYFVNPSYYIGTYYIGTLFSPSMNPK